jgi:sugar phosphate permease
MTWRLPKIFYGWWIVSSCFLISLLIGGIVVFGFTAFFEPIANEFHWSYAQISLASSLRGAEVGLLAPLIGLIVDRWGPRKLMFGGTILIGLGLILLTYTTTLGMFYVAFGLVAVGTSGSSPTVVMTAVAHWFRRKVGIATGIMVSGFALGALLVPVIVSLIDVFDWRTTFFILAICIWVIGLPLSLLVRHKPEQYGYLPDGEQNNAVIAHVKPATTQTDDVNIGAKQALKSRSFWHIGLPLTFQFLVVSTVIVHVMPYLSSVGIARSTSGMVAMVIPLTSIVGRLGSGWLGDRFSKIRLSSGFLIILCGGLLFLSYVTDEAKWLLVPFILLFGIGWGGNITMRAALLREYYGRSRFGTILGFLMGMTAVGAIVGPLFAGLAYDNWGSYQAAWLIYACLIFLALIIMATTPRVDTNAQSQRER